MQVFLVKHSDVDGAWEEGIYATRAKARRMARTFIKKETWETDPDHKHIWVQVGRHKWHSWWSVYGEPWEPSYGEYIWVEAKDVE